MGSQQQRRRGGAADHRRCALAWLLATAWCYANAQAQSPDAAVQEGLRRQEERARQLREPPMPAASVLRPPASKPSDELPAAETPCFVIHEVRLEGAGWERFAWITDAAAPYLRQCVGVRGLSRIASVLDAALLDRGFATTRVSLPQQNLQSGVLLVHVHVGRIARVRLVEIPAATANASNTETAKALEGGWSNAFPIAAGDVLDIRAIEQGVEQMRRLPSQPVQTRLEPGAAAETSDLVIERRAATFRERLRGGISIDNSGSQAMGRAQVSGNVALDNAFGASDILAASVSSNLQHANANHRSQSLNLIWSVPWGWSLLSVGAGSSRFAQYVQGTTARFLNSGHSETADAHITHTLWRGSSAKLSATAGLSVRRARSFIDDVELIVQRRRTTHGDVSVAWKQLLSETSSIDAEIGVRRGLSWHAQEDLPTATLGGPTLRPRITTFSATYNTRLDALVPQLRYTASLRGQSTRNATLAIDQFGIGGRYSVRGFDGDTVLLAESGATLHNDFSLPVQLLHGVNTEWTFALDVGRVWGPSDIYLPGRSLAGVATGLRGNAYGVIFDLTLAAPLSRPASFPARPWTAYASFTYPF